LCVTPFLVNKTAHFLVPKDVVHGQDLVCSFPVCRDTGVKFRFCLHCRIPVAKRNFRLRHNHLEAKPSGNGGSEVASSICVASDSASASRLSGYIPASHGPPCSHPTGSDSQTNLASRLPNTEVMADTPEEPGDHRRLKNKRKHLKHESSTKKRKPSKRKRPRLDADDREPCDSVPLTIRISSDKAAASTKSHRDEESSPAKRSTDPADVKLRAGADFERLPDPHASTSVKKSRKRSKRSSSKKGKHSKRRDVAVDYADVREEANKSMSLIASAVSTKSSKRQKRKLHEIDPTMIEANVDCKDADNSRQRVASEEVGDQDRKPPKKCSKKRLLIWANLLGERPLQQDDENMSKWLMNVLAVSDLKAPLKEELSSSPSSLSLEGSGSSED
jgi:hypothetical protein